MWIQTTQDAGAGTSQTSEGFWSNFDSSYEEKRAEDQPQRTVRSLESRWAIIRGDVSKFTGCLASVKALNRSGTNVEDAIEQAKSLFSTTAKKKFTLMHCWRIPEDNEKFKQQPQNRGTPMKRKDPLITSPESPIYVPDDADGEESEPGARAVGNKKFKRMQLEAAHINNNHAKLAEAATALAMANLQKTEAIRRAADLYLFTISTEGMDEESKGYILWQRRQVILQSGMGDHATE